MMRTALISVAAAVIAVISTVTPLPAQTMSAEVRTWTGQVYQLADPSLEVRYTIEVPSKNEGAGPAENAPTTGAQTPMLFGNAATISRFLENQPQPLQGHRESETVTLRKDKTEIRLPLANIAALLFVRQPAHSTLPSYVASQHYRYGATAVLADGSSIEGDYVSLGTTFLRGRTADGRVDIPWEQIEIVRFKR